MSKIDSFQSLRAVIPGKIVDKLESIYTHVDDIDLFVGGISETVTQGGILGPTFQCIIGDQFKRFQQADRFFFDSTSNPAPFIESQLAEIRKASLARITCDNGDSIEFMQREAFRRVTDKNPRARCQSSIIPSVSLLPWKDTALCIDTGCKHQFSDDEGEAECVYVKDGDWKSIS